MLAIGSEHSGLVITGPPSGPHGAQPFMCLKCGGNGRMTPRLLLRGDGCFMCRRRRPCAPHQYAREHVHRVAKDAVRRAVDAGELVRPSKCPRCGSGRRIEGHHESYLRPLDVTWLCKLCHARRHMEMERDGVSPWDGVNLPAIDAEQRLRNEQRKGYKCSVCGRTTHNRRTCPQRERSAA